MRHYELEIDMLAKVLEVLNSKVISNNIEKPATMRMKAEIEVEMI